MGGAEFLRFLVRLLRPDAGDQVIGGAAFGEEIHRHHRKLLRRATLDEQHLVAVGNLGEAARLILGLADDLLEELAPVAVLGDPHATAADVPEILLRLLQHRLGEHAGTGAKVVNTMVH
jgi:hypothetical protein